MHFFYIDEAGCNLRDLTHPESPIFVLGGLVVKDKGWNITHIEFEKIIERYFKGNIPNNFELHSHQLLSPKGEGDFLNHPREDRLKLAYDLLKLVEKRGHHFCLLPIEKSALNSYDTKNIINKDHVELKTPYLLCYDNIIDTIEAFIRDERGASARAMVIIDEKDSIKIEIESLTKFRRFHPILNKRIKWISEFSYPVDSKKNPMIQISDLACFITKKFYGIEKGYHNDYNSAAKTFYRDTYLLIHERLVKNSYTKEKGRNSVFYNDFLDSVVAKPSYRWKNKVY